MADKPNECCNVNGNLIAREQPERPDVTVMVCKVCGCRHFEVQVDPGRLGLLGAILA